MPSAIDNYKRKIAVELERRRRAAENNLVTGDLDLYEDEFTPIRVTRTPATFEPLLGPSESRHRTQIVLDDLDIFIIKKSRISVEPASCGLTSDNAAVKAYQPVIELAPPLPTTPTPQKPAHCVKVSDYPTH